MNKAGFLLIALSLISLCFSGCGPMDNESNPPTPEMNSFVLGQPGATYVVTGQGNTGMESEVFSLDDGCRSGKAEWSYEPRSENAFVRFAIRDGENRQATHWMSDENPSKASMSKLSLNPGTYYIWVDALDADWKFKLGC